MDLWVQGTKKAKIHGMEHCKKSHREQKLQRSTMCEETEALTPKKELA